MPIILYEHVGVPPTASSDFTVGNNSDGKVEPSPYVREPLYEVKKVRTVPLREDEGTL